MFLYVALFIDIIYVFITIILCTFGVQILPLADAAAGKGGYVPVTIFILPAGAFLVLAFLVAGMNRLKRHAAQKGKKIAEPQGCGTDCASCGGCGSKVFPTGNEE